MVPIYHTFLTSFNGVTPEQVDAMDAVLIEELIFFHKELEDYKERKRKQQK